MARELRIEVLDGGAALRLVDPAGVPLGRRSLAPGEIDRLVDEVGSAFDAPGPDLPRLGLRLFEWLNGSGQRWLAGAMEDLPGEWLTLRLDVGHRLRHLPWELAADGHACWSTTSPAPSARCGRWSAPGGRGGC